MVRTTYFKCSNVHALTQLGFLTWTLSVLLKKTRTVMLTVCCMDLQSRLCVARFSVINTCPSFRLRLSEGGSFSETTLPKVVHFGESPPLDGHVPLGDGTYRFSVLERPANETRLSSQLLWCRIRMSGRVVTTHGEPHVPLCITSPSNAHSR